MLKQEVRERLREIGDLETEAVETLEQQVDRYGQLQMELDAIDEKIQKRTRALQAEASRKREAMAALADSIIEEGAANVPASQGTKVLGEAFAATIGKKRRKSTITNMKRVAEIVGFDRFFELCSFSVQNAKDYLTPPERKECLEEIEDGPRTFKVQPRA